MRRVLGLLAVSVVCVAPLATRADNAADDWKALAGVWKVEKATLGGQDMTAALEAVTLTIEEGKYKLDFAGMSDKGTLSIDPARKPKGMMIKGTEGPNKDKSYPAIYEIEKDTLRICYNLDGKDPPTAFESKEGTKSLLAVYKRAKK